MPRNPSVKHSGFEPYAKKVSLVTTVLDGEDAVKSAGLLEPLTTMDRKSEEYKAYISRALMPTLAEQTKGSALGLLERREHTIELPETIERLRTDANGQGQKMTEFIRELFGFMLSDYRCGILIDAPREPSAEPSYTLKLYRGTSIINHFTTEVDGAELEVVVLREVHHERDADNFFDSKEVERYRVVYHRSGQLDRVELWSSSDDKATWTSEEVNPMVRGKKITGRIFFPVGSTTNDLEFGTPLLHPLCRLVLQWLRIDANINWSLPLTVPTVLNPMRSTAPRKVGEVKDGTIKPSPGFRFGGLHNFQADKGDSLKPEILEASGTSVTLNREYGKDIKEQALQTAVTVLVPSDSDRTATEVDTSSGNDQASLLNIVKNMSDALSESVKAIADTQNAKPDEVVIQLNQDFGVSTVDYQAIGAAHTWLQAGHYPLEQFFERLKKYGLVDRELEFEAYREQIQANQEQLDEQLLLGGSNRELDNAPDSQSE